MKGRYAGRHMTIYGYVLPGAISIARSTFLADNLTERAKQKEMELILSKNASIILILR